MCPSGATCLSANSCFSELALWKCNWTYWSNTKWTSSPFHWKLTFSSHHILPRLVQEVVANPLPYDHDTLPFYHIICMLYPKTEGMIFFLERYCRHMKEIMSFNDTRLSVLQNISVLLSYCAFNQLCLEWNRSSRKYRIPWSICV